MNEQATSTAWSIVRVHTMHTPKLTCLVYLYVCVSVVSIAQSMTQFVPSYMHLPITSCSLYLAICISPSHLEYSTIALLSGITSLSSGPLPRWLVCQLCLISWCWWHCVSWLLFSPIYADDKKSKRKVILIGTELYICAWMCSDQSVNYITFDCYFLYAYGSKYSTLSVTKKMS
jgi:hypothetical protein